MKNKGFTLIEVLVAIALFAIIVIPMGITINQALKASVKTKENELITQALNKSVEYAYNHLEKMTFDLDNMKKVKITIPDLSGSDLKFNEKEYRAEFELTRLDCDYDFILNYGPGSNLEVYKKVYDVTYGGVKYDLDSSVTVSSVVYMSVYRPENSQSQEILLIEKTPYNFVTNGARGSIFFIENAGASRAEFYINGVFKIVNGALTDRYLTAATLEMRSPNFSTALNPGSTRMSEWYSMSKSIYLIQDSGAGLNSQIYKVTVKIIDTKTDKTVKVYNFITRG